MVNKERERVSTTTDNQLQNLLFCASATDVKSSPILATTA